MKNNQTTVALTAIPELPFVETHNALVQIRDGVPMTSSLQVAQYFNKRHNDVLRDIRAIECSSEFHKRNFASLFYIREIGNGAQRKFPLIYMSKDGFTFLVMGFTGKVAAKFKEDYINAFNSMEQTLKMEAVPKRVLQDAQLQIESWKSKAAFWLNMHSQSTKLMGMMSKNELRLAEMMVEYREENKTLLREKEQAQATARLSQKSDYFTVVGYASLYNINCGIKLASSLGRKASVLCNAKGIRTEEIPDPRFGRIKTYPVKILDEVFNANAY